MHLSQTFKLFPAFLIALPNFLFSYLLFCFRQAPLFLLHTFRISFSIFGEQGVLWQYIFNSNTNTRTLALMHAISSDTCHFALIFFFRVTLHLARTSIKCTER